MIPEVFPLIIYPLFLPLCLLIPLSHTVNSLFSASLPLLSAQFRLEFLLDKAAHNTESPT